MPTEEARQYLLRYARHHEWSEVAIHEIAQDLGLAVSIRRYSSLAAELSEFDYDQWMVLVEQQYEMRAHVRAGDSTRAFACVDAAVNAWWMPRDARRVRCWMDQALWNCWAFKAEAASKAAATTK